MCFLVLLLLGILHNQTVGMAGKFHPKVKPSPPPLNLLFVLKRTSLAGLNYFFNFIDAKKFSCAYNFTVNDKPGGTHDTVLHDLHDILDLFDLGEFAALCHCLFGSLFEGFAFGATRS